VRLLAQVDERRNPRTNATLDQLLDRYLEMLDVRPHHPRDVHEVPARRIAPLWPLLNGIAEADWTDAIDMAGAQVAVADYCPNWWRAATRLLLAAGLTGWLHQLTATPPPTEHCSATASATARP
jgi:hypothetical protein